MDRGKRLLKLGANSAVFTVAVFAIVITAYYLSSKHQARFDLTKNRSNTLTSQTRGLLKSLDRPVQATGLFKTGSYEEGKVRDLLTEMARLNKNFTFKVIDPNNYPSITKELDVADYGIVFMSGKRKKVVYLEELFDIPDPMAGQEGAFKGEQAFYNAITSVAVKQNIMLCFTEGHGERQLTDEKGSGITGIAKLLEDQSFALTPLNMMEHKDITSKCGVLIVTGPQKPFNVLEITEIEHYLKKGGRLFVMIDPFFETGLEAVVAKYGVKMDNDIVIDPGGAFGKDAAELRPGYMPGPITDKLREEGLSINMLYARSLVLADGDDYKTAGLLVSSLEAWAEKSMDVYPKRDNGDRRGPLTLAAAVEAGEGAQQARIVVAGDSDYISNLSLSAVAQMSENSMVIERGGTGNADFFLNSVKWLAGEEKYIAIRPQTLDLRALNIDGETRRIAFYIFTFFIPGILLLAGWLVWRGRRSL